MKPIYNTILLYIIIINVLLLSFPLFSAEREYYSHIQSAQWETEVKETDFCRIKQKIPYYGEAVFTRKSGQNMLFELISQELILKQTKVTIMAEPAPWRQNELSFEIGSFILQEGHKPLTVKSPYASRMFQQIENGMMPTITYRDVADHKDIISVAISPIKFRELLKVFRQCESTLYEYDPQFLKDFDLYFATNQSKLTDRAKKNLGHIVKYLKINKDIKQVRIDAHADNIGRRRFNDKLSQRRGQVVKDYLLKIGAKEDMIYVKAHGEREPKNTNDTKIGRTKNRHAQIQLLNTPAPAPEMEDEVVEDETKNKEEEFIQSDKLNTPVPSFINLDHLIPR